MMMQQLEQSVIITLDLIRPSTNVLNKLMIEDTNSSDLKLEMSVS